ncbi:MAG TPA: carboxypeptidase-like regulatory domain-containing protein [Flavobacterium sp.]|uniref:carboxypeptidase-like regulatory domain-containing protein n=1 Tax=Flavobacterium sp. TaxID=239 RepID=UPI002B7192C2|nr:carboxypeptidase-like regulatory domain-containing protein [Flavobacterium sp.]HSD14831.1 carboxypeptidase-like regulatory domain-containing protein [Flavobacterium sp.]
MKKLFVIVTFVCSFFCYAQTKISGIVRDQETKKPLHGASIFAPQTTNGGATDETGLFSFTLIEGQTQVLISYVGYESVIVPASSFTATDKSNVIYLNPIVNNLKEVVIKKISAKQREKYMEIFNREFIGLGKIAEKTKILNPEVIQFDMNKENTLLIVTADAPLQLINEKTGYFISYELVYFESKVLTEEHNQKLTTFFGYPFFKDIVNEKELNTKDVTKTRLKCYKGSTMHFIRSLYNGTMESEGFTVLKFTRELNPDYPSQDSINRMMDAFRRNGKIPQIPAKHKIIYDKNHQKVHQLVFEREGKKYFYFTDFLSVVFRRAKEENKYTEYYHQSEADYQTSQLKLMEDTPIEIFADGTYAEVDYLGSFGYMGWKKMGEMLPFDYQPEPVVPN